MWGECSVLGMLCEGTLCGGDTVWRGCCVEGTLLPFRQDTVGDGCTGLSLIQMSKFQSLPWVLCMLLDLLTETSQLTRLRGKTKQEKRKTRKKLPKNFKAIK